MSSVPPTHFFLPFWEHNIICQVSFGTLPVELHVFQGNSEFKRKISRWPICELSAISFLVGQDGWCPGWGGRLPARFLSSSQVRQRWQCGVAGSYWGSWESLPRWCGFNVACLSGWIFLRNYQESSLTKTTKS